MDLGFQQVGAFYLQAEKLFLRLNNFKNNTGTYAFVVNQNIIYLGITTNSLYARMNGYKNPGPSQETNKRIKPKIVEAHGVSIYFLPEVDMAKFTTIIRCNKKEKQVLIDLKTFERIAISMCKPPWNNY